ncbi:pentatricopeptide repeat-containing protein At2g27800, mitochondrial isoform X2 [Cannabis sativa]|nr:pentatricopeptide repeat-containing protein At2g27800, mitochondrial isoform X2 [Cannabis sativa]
MAPKGHKPCSEISSNGLQRGFEQLTLCSFYSTKPICRSYRRRVSKRLKASNKPILDEAQFQRALSQLLPRFTAEELANVMAQQDDPLVCLELFNWASQQPRFKHDASTYHIAVKKLGAAEMYEEMDDVVNQVLAISHMGTEALFNTIIYFFTEARKLTRAINIYKHMKNSRNLACRPSIRTYNTLFAAFLSRGNNSYINHVYMDTVRGLFRQMVNDGIEPDIFSLNSMVKGYVLSLHVNDALRIFHQMGVVYNCVPNSFTYDYLIHGLCAQGRTNNAIELCNQMKSKSFIPSGKSYNSLVNALALSGDVEEAIKYLWEMIEQRRPVDTITYRTVLDEVCRSGRIEDAMKLLKQFQEKDLVDGHLYRKLLHVLEDDFGHSTDNNKFRSPLPDQDSRKGAASQPREMAKGVFCLMPQMVAAYYSLASALGPELFALRWCSLRRYFLEEKEPK